MLSIILRDIYLRFQGKFKMDMVGYGFCVEIGGILGFEVGCIGLVRFCSQQ